MTPPDGPDREVPYRDPLAPPSLAEPAGGPVPVFYHRKIDLEGLDAEELASVFD